MRNLNVLYIIHTGIINSQGFIGGTQLHTDLLARSNRHHNAYLLYYEDESLVLEHAGKGSAAKRVMLPVRHTFNPLNRQNDYREIYKMILKVYAIDLLHIQHLMNHTISIITEAEKLNIPILFTIHDLYTVCPSIYLTDLQDNYCAGKIVETVCAECIAYKARLEFSTLRQWREEFNKCFSLIDGVIAPSALIIDILKEHYTLTNTMVIPHGTVIEIKEPPSYSSGIFNVAFVGHLAAHKGSKTVKELIQGCDDDEVLFHSFGKIDDYQLEKMQKSNFIKHGEYEQGKLQSLLKENNIHLVALLSNCPESFSFTLSESWQSAMPVIGCNIGAIGSRIAETGAGILVDVNNPVAETLAAIKRLKSNRDQYLHYVKKSQQAPHKTIDQMIDQYFEIYYQIADHRERKPACCSDLQSFMEEIFLDEASDRYKNDYYLVMNELYSIKSSLIYKVLVSIKKVNIPGREKLKRLAVKIINSRQKAADQ